MEIKNQRDYFNEQYKNWLNSVDKNKIRIMQKSIRLLKIGEHDSVLDVACGTGVLYPLLMNIPIKEYMAIDISEKMLEEFARQYKDVKMQLLDFEKPTKLKDKYDYIIIFNSIPHFEDLNAVFQNSKNNLKDGGKLSIIHTRTRLGLVEHHNRIDYNLGRAAIPKDDTLDTLCNEHGFKIEEILDDDFFFFSCKNCSK